MKKIFILLVLTSYFFLGEATQKTFTPYYVGELGEKWQFTSDHLPIGLTIDNIHIAHWNTLNKDYLYHIDENTQGLKKSAIKRDDTPVQACDFLTVREAIIGWQVIEMVTHPTHPRSLITLQELNRDVLGYLERHLPKNWVIKTPPNQPFSQDVFLYDTDVFEFVDLDAVKYDFRYPKTIFTLTLREKSSGKKIRFVQSHVPYNPLYSKQGCAQFAELAIKQFDPDLIMVLMGDMNQSPDVVQSFLEKAALDKEMKNPYRHCGVEYPSHINTHLQASWIDHFFIYTPEKQKITVEVSHNPEEVCSTLVSTVQLLDRLKPVTEK